VAPALLVGRGTSLFLDLGGRDPPLAFPRGDDLGAAIRATVDPPAQVIPSDLVEAIAELAPDVRLVAADRSLAEAVSRATGREVREATVGELRAALPRLPLSPAPREREFALQVAHAALAKALAAPGEVLITLAREEERVERALGREERAMEAFLTAASPGLEQYRRDWSGVRDQLARHHDRLVALLERSARSVAPNLSAVVGEKVAARLIAIAGSLDALGRMRSARIQLLGSHRRPSPEHGPRYGVLYRAARMADVPTGRRGAYARSLAALAAIAARVDATTRRDLAPILVARRDRRVESFRRSRR
jgi:hypothetical protein